MTIREWIEENGIDAIVYDNNKDKYLFQCVNEQGLCDEGDIVINHSDYEMVLDYEIIKIDYELNDKPTLYIYVEYEDDEEEEEEEYKQEWQLREEYEAYMADLEYHDRRAEEYEMGLR